MDNSLGKKVTFLSLIKHTFPTIIMMVFFSLYTIIDGVFVSRFVGSNALSSINIVFPVVNIILGISIMLATGGNAIVAKLMGEGKDKDAKEGFTLIIITALAIGIFITIISLIFIKPIIYALGATEVLYEYCYSYLFIMMMFSPIIILKCLFDYFLISAGAPKLGLLCTILGGITNIILDYIFIVKFNMGIAGASLATCIGYAFPAIIGLIYFLNKKNILHFTKTKFNLKLILKSCGNGSSEMVTQISSAVTTYLYNIVMIKFLGETGVAAITIVLYSQLLLISAHIGFTSGVSPRISYNYGNDNKIELKKLVKYSYIFILIFSIVSFIFSRAFSTSLVGIFTSKSSEVYNITLNGFNIFAYSFLICGINIFASGMFTAFSNGKISAIISLLRTFIFFILGIIILPFFMGVDGVWLVVPFSEILTLMFSLYYTYKFKNTYGY